MKKYIITVKIIFSLVVAFCLSGCLKDKEYDDHSNQSVRTNGDQKIIEIQLTATDVTNFLSYAYNNGNTDTIVDFIPVVLASANGAEEDINVTLVAKPTLVTDYNAANGTGYLVPTAAMHTVINPGLVVKIAKGTNRGFLQIKFKPADFLGGEWALGYSIASVDKPGYTISGNLKNGIAAIGIKNQYDGHYKSKGVFSHPTPANNSTWIFTDGITRDLITFSAAGVYAYPLKTKAATFGVELDLTVNADKTVTTVFIGTTDDPDAVPNPSRYDGASKTFFIDAWYGGHTRHLVDTLVYTGPR